MDAKDVEILQLASGKPYLLGVGSFGTVRAQSAFHHCESGYYAGACINMQHVMTPHLPRSIRIQSHYPGQVDEF